MGRPSSVFNEREQTEFHVCKAVEDNPYMQSRKSNIIEFQSAQVESTDLNEIIEEDKRYGTFQPKNGSYYTYRVLNEDEEITNEASVKVNSIFIQKNFT